MQCYPGGIDAIADEGGSLDFDMLPAPEGLIVSEAFTPDTCDHNDGHTNQADTSLTPPQALLMHVQGLCAILVLHTTESEAEAGACAACHWHIVLPWIVCVLSSSFVVGVLSSSFVVAAL